MHYLCKKSFASFTPFRIEDAQYATPYNCPQSGRLPEGREKV